MFHPIQSEDISIFTLVSRVPFPPWENHGLSFVGCAEILTMLQADFLEGNSQNYLFEQGLINAQRKAQHRRLIFNSWKG